MKQSSLNNQLQVRKAPIPPYYSHWRVLFVISFWGLALPVYVRRKTTKD